MSKRGWIGAATLVVATGAGTLVVLNLFPGERKVEYEIRPGFGVRDAQFQRTMGALLGPALLPGNRITAFQNGDQIFPAMLEAIRGARHTITFETFIYWSGQVGEAFAAALSERARSGVAVHVLLDWAGSNKMDETQLNRMKAAGVEVLKFHPLHWYHLARLNNRTHRKLLVVDGEVAFTGGVGIGDVWLGNAQDSLHWRDSHYRLEGPAVSQMQAAFMDNWLKTRSKVLEGEQYFPPLDSVGDSRAQVFLSSRDEGSESVRLMYLLSLAAARSTIRISTAYFVPDSLVTQTLVSAAQRGVRVEIIVPGPHIDVRVVRRASRNQWGPLLEAGVAIYEYQPTLYHCKVMIVDDIWTSVGSTNFDIRSFRLNAEANLNVLDSAFAAEQIQVFEADRARSRRITLEEWRRRPWREKILGELAALIRSQL